MHIEFSSHTQRLRRNLIGASFVIIAVAGFDVRVGSAAAGGLQLENLTTDAVLIILLAFVLYHLVIFGIYAFEDYRVWELKTTERQAAGFGGGISLVDLSNDMENVADTLTKILENGGSIISRNQEILNEADASQLKRSARSARIYAERWKSLPRITRFRFWALDIGLAGVTTAVAIMFVLSWIPKGALGLLFIAAPAISNP